MATQVTQVQQLFVDSAGAPLATGYLYIGSPGQNPETSPVTVYWDEGLTVAASQPIAIVGGQITRNGVQVSLYVDGAHSITVRDANRRVVDSVLNVPASTEDQDLEFPSREAFVAWLASGYAAPDGAVASDGTVQYVAAPGATAISDLPGWLPFESVRPYHFGADGTPDNDTAAIQAALDTGWHVDMTPRAGENLYINATITASTAGQRIFSRIPRGGEFDANGHLVLEGAGWTGGVAVLCTSTKIFISDLSFIESDTSATGSLVVVKALRTTNTDDLDFTMQRCGFQEVTSAWTVLQAYGRGTQVDDILSNCDTGVEIYWPSSGTSGPSDQLQPLGHRALRLTNFRLHGTGSNGAIRLLKNADTDVLRGFTISNINVDIGDRLIYSDIILENGVIEGCTAEWLVQNNLFEAEVRRCSFVGNYIGGKDGETGESPFASLRFDGGMTDVTISGNTFGNVDAYAIHCEGEARNVKVIGNSFINIGQDGGAARAAVGLFDAWGVEMSGNSGHRMWGGMLASLGAVTSTDSYWRSVTAERNVHDGTAFAVHGFTDPDLFDAGGNSIQADPTVNAQTGAAYTLQTSDPGKLVTMSNAAANVVSIDTFANVGIPTGSVIEVKQTGDGATTITALSGVTLNGVSQGSAVITSKMASVYLYRGPSDTWQIRGDHGTVS